MNTPNHILGVMSGTSMDGVDLALCHFDYSNGKWKYEILSSECIPYNDEWIKKLSDASSLNGYDLIKLHKEYGAYIGGLAAEFLKKSGSPAALISSHGHTIFHNPAELISFQLGDGAAIAARSGLPVVCDFRSLDVCLGGQGAPLVPIGDKLLFGEFGFCLNLGGIANISFEANGKRIAYDICPCNLLLNHYAQLSGEPYDKDGEMAKDGSINEALLAKLQEWEYYRMPSPKSLDKDSLLNSLLPLIDSLNISNKDKLATLTEHIAERILADIENHIKENDKNSRVLLTGGGAFNAFLIQKLKKSCRADFVIPDAQIINFKEALVFAFLGLLRLLNKTNTLASVTGAKRDSSGGAIYLPANSN